MTDKREEIVLALKNVGFVPSYSDSIGTQLNYRSEAYLFAIVWHDDDNVTFYIAYSDKRNDLDGVIELLSKKDAVEFLYNLELFV